MKYLICLTMAALISNIPYVAAAETATYLGKMVPTSAVVEELSREQVQSRIEQTLRDTEIKSKLEKLGLNEKEISLRLASLSDSEIRKLSHQIDQAKFGGDVTGILILVVLVLLIIYLAKRI